MSDPAHQVLIQKRNPSTVSSCQPSPRWGRVVNDLLMKEDEGQGGNVAFPLYRFALSNFSAKYLDTCLAFLKERERVHVRRLIKLR